MVATMNQTREWSSRDTNLKEAPMTWKMIRNGGGDGENAASERRREGKEGAAKNTAAVMATAEAGPGASADVHS